jgi:hypothetical protein
MAIVGAAAVRRTVARWVTMVPMRRGNDLVGRALIVTVAAATISFGALACTGDDDNGDQTDVTEELNDCPDQLEAQGPFVSGVDPGYDPSMDWDGDGVSCE